MPFDGAGFPPAGYVEEIDKITDLIGTPNKWCMGSLRTRDGRYCLRGAITEVDGSESIYPIVLAAINEVTARHYQRIESFNDRPETDHEQVLAVLMRARETILARQVSPAASRSDEGPTLKHGGPALVGGPTTRFCVSDRR